MSLTAEQANGHIAYTCTRSSRNSVSIVQIHGERTIEGFLSGFREGTKLDISKLSFQPRAQILRIVAGRGFRLNLEISIGMLRVGDLNNHQLNKLDLVFCVSEMNRHLDLERLFRDSDANFLQNTRKLKVRPIGVLDLDFLFFGVCRRVYLQSRLWIVNKDYWQLTGCSLYLKYICSNILKHLARVPYLQVVLERFWALKIFEECITEACVEFPSILVVIITPDAREPRVRFKGHGVFLSVSSELALKTWRRRYKACLRMLRYSSGPFQRLAPDLRRELLTFLGTL